MEDYDAIIQKNKEKSAESEQKPNREPIVSGTVKKQSSLTTFGKSIVSEDADTVGKHVRDDIFIPTLKKFITDIVKSTVDWFIYGVKGNPNNPPRTTSNVSYGSYYSRPTYSSPSYANPITNGGFALDIVEIADRGSAEVVLQRLKDDIARYGCVSCGAYYEYVGVKAPYTAENFGWRDLTSACVERRSNGSYSINFPRIQSLK